LTSINSFGQTVSTIGQTSETPSGIAVDATGNVYFAERSPGSKISKLNQTTGISTIFSNSGINDPMDIEFGPNNDIFVADYGANAILRVPSTGGAASVYVSGTSGPAGVVFDADTLYFIEYVSQIIYKVLPGGGAVGSANVIQISNASLWMGCPNARGTGLEMLTNGNLFVTSALCYASYEIDKVTGSIVNNINSVEGTTFSAVRLADNNIYMPGLYSHQILKWDINSSDDFAIIGDGSANSVDGDASTCSFDGPYFIAKDQDDNLYVTEANSKKIRKITNTIVSVPEFENTIISIYPNPSTIDINIQLSKVNTIRIFTVEGRLVTQLSGSSNYLYNTEIIENGIYFIQTENGTTQKFIKQ
jgi:sugar lactone lactonase YvrE